MDSLDDLKSSSHGGFFKQVFNFDESSKADMLNVVQYAVIAIIPIVLLNKGMQKYVPEADEDKGSFEILAEVLIQVIVVLYGLFFINRLVAYVPTWSGEKYPNFHVVLVVPIFLVITLSLQTKLGEKVSILFDRVGELWNGGTKKQKRTSTPMRVMQPLAGVHNEPVIMEQSYGTTSINQLPTDSYTQEQPLKQQQLGSNNPQNFDNFGSNIQAANEALGGSSFGANF